MPEIAAHPSQIDQFEDIIDVRSPMEFSKDHIQGSQNFPVLNDAERDYIGKIFNNESKFKAKKVGAALVAKNISVILEKNFINKSREWRPLIYCWRGGQRSGSMSTVLRRIGWDAKILAGGYKAYRRHVIEQINTLTQNLSFKVFCGPTGSRKTDLLQFLKNEHGCQVLDLENLASHKGSVLGALEGVSQPSQKMFESRLYKNLSKFKPEKIVFIESESKRIGSLHLPAALTEKMWNSDCIIVKTDIETRIKYLAKQYSHFIENSGDLIDRLQNLTRVHSKGKIDEWTQLIKNCDWRQFLYEILVSHYDKKYQLSISAHYGKLKNATEISLSNNTKSIEIAASEILKSLKIDSI